MGDQMPAPYVEPERTCEGLSAADLKAVIVDAALAGYYTFQEAEDLLQEYGLVHA